MMADKAAGSETGTEPKLSSTISRQRWPHDERARGLAPNVNRRLASPEEGVKLGWRLVARAAIEKVEARDVGRVAPVLGLGDDARRPAVGVGYPQPVDDARP